MDLVLRAVSEKHHCKISIVDLSEGFQEIVKLQKPNPLAMTALGKVIANTTLLALGLKDGDKLAVALNGMGLAGNIVGEYEDRHYRGFVQFPDFDVKEIDEGSGLSSLAQTVGVNGFLQASRSQNGHEPYVSRTELVTGEVNVDFMAYTQQSDQIHTLIASTVEVDDNGNAKKLVGILIQLLPESREEDIDFLEEKIGSLEHLTKTLIETKNYEALVKDICEDAKILEAGSLEYKCTCSVEKVMDSIKMLSREEIEQAYAHGEVVEVVCEFCKKKYRFDIDEIREMFN